MKRKLLFAMLCTLLQGISCYVSAGDVKRDVTSLIKNPTFDTDISNWENENNGFGHEGKNDKFSTGFAQIWTGGTTRTGRIYQTITNLPSGTYRLTAQCIGGYQHEPADIPADYLYAKLANEESINQKADVNWISGDVVEERTLNFTNNANQNVEIGFCANGTSWWSAIDDVKLYAIDLSAAAYELPNSDVTAGSWYKFTTGSSNDVYILSSSGNATLTYTTDGTITNDDGITSTWSLTAKQNVLLAPSTTYYIKSSAAVTLTKTESSVNSSYVSGWTKVTSISDLQNNSEDYFFAIYSANNTGLMLGASGNYADTQKPYYKTATNPLTSTAYLFEIENYDNAFVLKSSAIGKYFKNTSSDPWFYHATETSTSSDCKITVTFANGVYVLQTAHADGGAGNYLGLWDPSHGYKDGEYLAGNKQATDKGSFLIYRIAKNNLDLTSLITNPDFSASTWSEGWTGTGSDKAKAFLNNTNSSFTGTMAEMWVANGVEMSAANLNQTIKELPAGVYTLSAKVQAGIPCKLYATVSGEDQYTLCYSSVKTESLTFTVQEAGDVTIGLKHDGVSSASGDTWVAVDDFTLSVAPAAVSSDYTALATAITAYNAATWGFETGEYAPYNNVTVIENIDAAKAINSSAINSKVLVNSLTDAITLSSPNASNVNAIYDGDFSESEVGTYNTVKAVTGWDKVEGMREVVTSNVEGSPLYNKQGIYVWGTNTVTYGNTAGYILPLGTNKIYRASYKRASWSGNSNRRAVLTVNHSNGDPVATFDPGEDSYATTYNEAGSLLSESIYFVTGADPDNYTLSLCPWGNAVFTDVELISVDALPLSESSKVYYSAGTYPSVSFTRSFTADNWNTLCLPFAFDKSRLTAVKELSSVTENSGSYSLTFSDASTTVAGKPYIVQGSGEITLTGTNVEVVTDPVSTTKSDITFEGTFSQKYAPQNSYIISGTNFYLVDKENAVTVKPYRGYFTVQSAGPVKALLMDVDGTDGIASVETTETENSAIYNLAGQRVQKAQKGLYIINGKKVVVK